MEYVEPIKDIASIKAIKAILRQQSQRDLLLFVFGINTGIRVSDLLSLKVEDIWDGVRIKEFLHLRDTNVHLVKAYYLNNQVQKELKNYLSLFTLRPDEYLFRSKKGEQAITRQQAYRIIHSAAKKVGVTGKIGMHTLRKTFGYHAYRKGIAISILQNIYNHHSPAETLRYIGIDKQDAFLVKVDVNL